MTAERQSDERLSESTQRPEYVTPAEVEAATICGRSGQSAQSGRCPLHGGDACLAQYVHYRISDALDHENRTLRVRIAGVEEERDMLQGLLAATNREHERHDEKVAQLQAALDAVRAGLDRYAWHEETCEHVRCGYDQGEHTEHDDQCACTCGFTHLLATLGGRGGA
jgi:hypothetical protein